jgi:hypothetical protein
MGEVQGKIFVVTIDEIVNNRVGFPNNENFICMIDNSRKACCGLKLITGDL